MTSTVGALMTEKETLVKGDEHYSIKISSFSWPTHPTLHSLDLSLLFAFLSCIYVTVFVFDMCWSSVRYV